MLLLLPHTAYQDKYMIHNLLENIQANILL